MDAHDELVRTVQCLGYPAEFGQLLASELRSEQAMRRLLAYLRQACPHSPADIVDEMLAIRDASVRWRERKIAEHAQESLTRFYNRTQK